MRSVPVEVIGMILSLLVAAALWSGSAAPKPAAAAATPAAPKAAPAKDNQLVCKTEPAPGSRLLVRTCHTVADLRTRQLLDRQELEHMQLDRSPGY